MTNYDYRCIYDFYKKKIETKTTIDSQLDFLLQMYCHGSIEMTKSWVEKNMYLDIETLVNMLIESMPGKIETIYQSLTTIPSNFTNSSA